MTLIAAWKEKEVPFLIGDLVVSTLGYSRTPHASLPTRDDLEELIPSSWHGKVAKTCQKVYKISDSFVIGWCDTLFTAKTIIDDVKYKFQDSFPDLATVENYFRSQTNYENPPCTIVGWLLDNQGSHCFRWSSDKPSDIKINEMFVEGSGKRFFEDIFNPQIVLGSGNPVNLALGRLAHLLGHEVLYGTNLWNLFGGGFQIIYLKNNSFEFLPSITFIFWSAREGERKIDLIQNRRILNFQYEGDYLRTTALINSPNQQRAERELHYTSTLFHNYDFEGPKKPITLDAQYYCFYVDLFLKENIAATWVYAIEDSEKEGILEIKKGQDNLHSLILGEEFFNKLASFLKQLDRNNLPDID